MASLQCYYTASADFSHILKKIETEENIAWIEWKGADDACGYPLFVFNWNVTRVGTKGGNSLASDYGHKPVFNILVTNTASKQHTGCVKYKPLHDKDNATGDVFLCYHCAHDNVVFHDCSGNQRNYPVLKGIFDYCKKTNHDENFSPENDTPLLNPVNRYPFSTIADVEDDDNSLEDKEDENKSKKPYDVPVKQQHRSLNDSYNALPKQQISVNGRCWKGFKCLGETIRTIGALALITFLVLWSIKTM